jgi:hypothetical protein
MSLRETALQLNQAFSFFYWSFDFGAGYFAFLHKTSLLRLSV